VIYCYMVVEITPARSSQYGTTTGERKMGHINRCITSMRLRGFVFDRLKHRFIKIQPVGDRSDVSKEESEPPISIN